MKAAPCFRAQVVGVRVRRTGHGSVHSVFARALNLSGGGAWLVLQSPDLPPVAHSVQVAWPYRDLREHFVAGGPWRWEGECLVIALRDSIEVRVCAQQVAVWSSPLSLHAADSIRIALEGRALWRECARVAAGRSVFWAGAHARIAMSARRARQGLRLLRRARDGRDVDAAVRALIGLGPGLTPAGDDALIGWLAGMALLPQDPARDSLARAARRTIAECLPRTTDVSRAHLEDALAGQFSHALSLFANALVEENAALDRAPGALQELARVGASSGLDAAAGLLAALSAPARGARAPADANRTSATENTELTERFQSISGAGQLTRLARREPHVGVHSLSVFSVSSVSSVAGIGFPD